MLVCFSFFSVFCFSFVLYYSLSLQTDLCILYFLVSIFYFQPSGMVFCPVDVAVAVESVIGQRISLSGDDATVQFLSFSLRLLQASTTLF
jgi:hypothetical protein